MVGRVLRWMIVGAFCSTAATCGQKGPLELPDEQAVSAAKAYDVVPKRPGSVCSTLGESDGLRA